MGLKVRKEQGVPVVELSGEFWGGNETREVQEVVRGLLETGERRIVLDVYGARHLNSTAIGAIVGLRTSALNRGGELVMAYGPGSKLHHVLVMIKLEFIFKPFTSVEDAVGYFKAAGGRETEGRSPRPTPARLGGRGAQEVAGRDSGEHRY